MHMQDQQSIKVQVHNDLLGSFNFQFSPKTHTSDLRLHILENSSLCIYQNFHLEYEGRRLPDCNQISQIFKGEVKLLVVLDPFDDFSSKYHEQKVRGILMDPQQWALVSSRQSFPKSKQETQYQYPAMQLDRLFEAPFSSPLFADTPKEYQFGNIINSSGFNPPHPQRKLLGDLYYLQIKTLEDVDFHVTANSQGFFVNQSSQGNFNGHPHSKYNCCTSLLTLLFQLSPKFKAKFQDIVKNLRVTQNQKTRQSQKSNPSCLWMAEAPAWRKNTTWKNDSYSHQPKNDYTVIKDWVQIFQYQLSSTPDSLPDRLTKEKLRYRIYQEFIENIKECVLKIFNGTMKPLNASSKLEDQIFYYSSLLFYFTKEHDQPDSTLRSGYITNQQIDILSLTEPLALGDVQVTHSAVIRFRGYQIGIKAIPNSFLDTTLQCNSYRDILAKYTQGQHDDAIQTAVSKICKALGCQSQSWITDKQGENKLYCLSPDLAVRISNQKKRYILEGQVFAARDLNFNTAESSQCQCFLRPELIKLYNSHQKCHILYNPNIGTSSCLSSHEKHRQQQQKLQSLAKFAKQIMVPALIDSFEGDMRKYLADSHSILSTLHRFGLSSKYLGLIYKKSTDKQAHHVKIMIERTILVRSLKTFFNKALRETPLFLHKTLVKHLLNCLFEEDPIKDAQNQTGKTDDEVEWSANKKPKKRKNRQNESCFQISFAKGMDRYISLKKEDFWQSVKEIALSKYNHVLAQKPVLFQFQFSKVAILRDLCLCIGMVIQKKDYFSQTGPSKFSEENILSFRPKVKVMENQARQLNQLIQEGDKMVVRFQIDEAFDSYNKAFQYVFSTLGEQHQKLGLMYKKFAGLHSKVGDLQAAVMFSLHSYEIYNSIEGVDHVETIEALAMVGVYEFGRRRFAAAEYYLLKAIFQGQLAYSQCYPEILVLYMNLSTVYEAQKKYTQAIMSLFLALNISMRVYGQQHLHTAIVLSALASLHYDIPDISQAIKFQQKAVSILQQALGQDDQRVQEAKIVCQGYKNVQNSKKIRETHEKDQRNPLGLPSLNKFNAKSPFFDFRERAGEFNWKKPPRRLKYFF